MKSPLWKENPLITIHAQKKQNSYLRMVPKPKPHPKQALHTHSEHVAQWLDEGDWRVPPRDTLQKTNETQERQQLTKDPQSHMTCNTQKNPQNPRGGRA